MCPDVEFRRHLLEEILVAAWYTIKPTKGVGSWVVGEALRLEHGGGSAIVVSAYLSHPRLELLDRTSRR